MTLDIECFVNMTDDDPIHFQRVWMDVMETIANKFILAEPETRQYLLLKDLEN